MKKVIIISSSPRHGGNSDVLCDQFAEGARSQGHEVEKIFIHDMNLHYCMGCYHCKKEKKCVFQDGISDILQKMIDADVIVLSSPVYFYTIDGQMKTFIDRCLPRYTEIRNKDFYYIVTAADSSYQAMERTIECFRGFLDCLPGAREKDIIFGVGAWQKGDILNMPVMQEAQLCGKKI